MAGRRNESLHVRRATQGVIAWLDEIGVDAGRGVVVGRDGP